MCTDHPRSRGVYATGRPPIEGGSGSSPLARGLRPRRTSRLRRFGIIPARAGFTQRVSCPYPRLQDHPRSRGVYAARAARLAAAAGSSPLARGLRRWCDRCLPRGPDHPRSRGVYGTIPAALLVAAGSSPLARGLRDRRASQGHRGRIIPARAGFTGLRGFGINGPGDHPRSRGVYFSAGLSSIPAGGSSPLARGLPFRFRGWTHVMGIIPARAGFTSTIWGCSTRSGDHPRSRGVYDRYHDPHS